MANAPILSYTYDVDARLSDGAAAITADGYSQVSGSDGELDLGDDTVVFGDLVIDVSAIDVAGGDETYDLIVVCGDTSGLGSGTTHEVARLRLGDSTVHRGSADSTVGRYVLPVHNIKGGTTEEKLRYMRLYVDGTAGVNFSITFTAFLARRQ